MLVCCCFGCVGLFSLIFFLGGGGFFIVFWFLKGVLLLFVCLFLFCFVLIVLCY